MLKLAVQNGLPDSAKGKLEDWTSHVFRRGSAVDILQAKGISAMLEHGGWAVENSAWSYASLDEIDTESLRRSCDRLVDLSDDGF